MVSTKNSDKASDPESSAYGDAYYASYGAHLGHDHAYSRGNTIFKTFFENIADAIVRNPSPANFLDAGCAIGFLVEALRDRGVDARGFDISVFAIRSIPEALRPFIHEGSLLDEIEGTFDMISCIEVLEHLEEEFAQPAIENLCRHTDAVLFSSSPDDFDDPTHLNVRDGDYWALIFASQGFFRDFTDEVAQTISPQAVLFRRSVLDLDDSINGYEHLLTTKSLEFKASREFALREVREIRSHLARSQLELSLSELRNHGLESYQIWSEEHKKTRLYRMTRGVRELYSKLRRWKSRKVSSTSRPVPTPYQQWIGEYEPIVQDFFNLMVKNLETEPRISLVMPTYNTSLEFLEDAVQSVKNQSYTNWELCIADDASTDQKTLEYLEQLREEDSRIKVIFRSDNGHIAAASNSALSLATGDWIALLDHDDKLAPHALAGMVLAASEHPTANLLYSDRDLFSPEIGRFSPFFKSDYDPELILSLNYICHFQMMRKSMVDEIGGFGVDVDGSQDWDIALRIISRSKAEQIIHVPYVLYHWRLHSNSVSSDVSTKQYAIKSAENAVSRYIQENLLSGTTTSINSGGWHNIVWDLPEKSPSISILLVGESSQNADEIQQSLVKLTEQSIHHFESLVVDHGPKFNISRLLNHKITQIDSEYICILDSNCAPTDSTWLTSLLRHCSQPDIGVVAPAVVTSDFRFLHTGVVMGLEGSCGEIYQGLSEESAGLYGRLLTTRNVSAVSNACMLFKRSVWEDVGGFNENETPHFRGHVDFCLKIREHGKRVLWTPSVKVRSSEKASPPILHDPAWDEEDTYLRARWAPQMLNDLAFSPNLEQSVYNSGFDTASPPRVMEFLRHGRVTSE